MSRRHEPSYESSYAHESRRFRAGALSLVLFAGASIALGMASTSQSASTPGTPGDLAPVAMELLPALERASEVGPVDPNRVLHVSVSLAWGDEDGIQIFDDAVSNPSSREYRHFLTPEEVGEHFGRSAQEVRRVVNYLVGQGFHIRLVAKNRLAILADATVAQAQAAFHTRIREFTLVPKDDVEPAVFIAPTSAVLLPKEIAPIVIDVSGLETYTHPRHRNTTLLTPALTRGLYDTQGLFASSVQGQGRTIGISNFVGFRTSNAVLYVNHFGLPVPAGGAGSNITVIPISGGAGTGADDPEGDLDIQMELGMAPLANIIVYDGGGDDLIGTLTREANDNAADAISESYGWNISASTATSAHNQHLSMTAEGITYMAASGDSGTSLEPYSYPNYEPEVLQIGGTTANVNSTTGARVTEVGWSGSGGGWSTKTIAFNVRPSWQVGNGVLPIAEANKRLCPDIAFHASGSSGSCGGAYQFYTGGGLQSGYCGTSFASPAFCGMLAVTEQQIISTGGLPADGHGHRRMGRTQDLIYQQNGRSDIWHDITSGANGNRPDGTASVCTAGWDTVTGWGPMDCASFANIVGCGVDSDGDGVPDCIDGCPNDPNKTAPGLCGCGYIDSTNDSDGDGTPDCTDGCPYDPNKTAPGVCGCGVPDTDTDHDGTPDCHDGCPNDPAKTAPGQCGCGVPDTDSDGDGTANCIDGCPNDPNKVAPGICGCGVPDTDTDHDGTPDCNDGCPNDPNKTSPGQCGCGVADTDSDGDGTPDCHDGCPNDPNKITPGICGCGVSDVDTDGDGIPDCNDNCVNIPNPDQMDCDNDGNGDVCQIANGAPDCNGNGQLDSCDIANGLESDVNHDGIPDSCELAGAAYCFGDGTDHACPCGNSGAAGHGCANSIGQSAVLSAIGTTSPDTAKLYVVGTLNSSFCVFLQGTANVGPFLYGDGLRCVGGTLKRLYSKNASGGNASAPQGSELSITAQSAALGDPIASGTTRYYIVSYRDPNPNFCPSPTGGTFNASNSVSIAW
jgi:hypothetical protein